MATTLKQLVGTKMQKVVKFMGNDVKISKLTVMEVQEIQEASKTLKEDSEEGLDILYKIIRSTVEGGHELSDSDFAQLPMDELSKLSGEIMKFSGIGKDEPVKT